MASRPTAYHKNEPYVFFSYSHQNPDIAFPIISAMQKSMRVWYDEGIEAGEQWRKTIADQVANCSGMICLVTVDFLFSKNCRREIEFASELDKPILIVYPEKITLPVEFQFSYGHLHALCLQDFPSVNDLARKIQSTEALTDCLFRPGERATEIYEPTPSTPEELYQFGKQAMEQKSHASAVSYFRRAAEQDYAPALYELGICYRDGIGITQNSREADAMFQKAAISGYAPAQNILANTYYWNKKYDEAFSWYKKSADQKDFEGMCGLARMYRYGTGVDKDEKAAFLLYKECANHWYPRAEYELAKCYHYGNGTKVDLHAAAKWYSYAAEAGHDYSQMQLGILHYYGSYREQSDSLASYWMHKAAEQDSEYNEEIARCKLDKGLPEHTVEECIRRAEVPSPYSVLDFQETMVFWYTKAAELGSVTAMRELAEHYHLMEDYYSSVEWYRKAAELGDAESQYELGRAYQEGKGVIASTHKALKWFKKAAKQDDSYERTLLECYAEILGKKPLFKRFFE